MSDPPSFSSS